LVWNDVRTHDICEKLSAEGGKDRFRSNTGLPISPYFSGSKLSYLLNVVPGLRADAERGDAIFGTIDSYLIWKLTGGQGNICHLPLPPPPMLSLTYHDHSVHATDVSNASRTLMFSLSSLSWDTSPTSLIQALSIPSQMLPTVHPSSGYFGVVSSDNSFEGIGGVSSLAGVPIAGVLGDQQAALFGQACFEPGQAKCTYGTGCFMLKNTGENIVPSGNEEGEGGGGDGEIIWELEEEEAIVTSLAINYKHTFSLCLSPCSAHGLLTTVAYQLQGKKPIYALEGSVAYSGSLIQWLRDNLQVLPTRDLRYNKVCSIIMFLILFILVS
jgi:glycerol kinase